MMNPAIRADPSFVVHDYQAGVGYRQTGAKDVARDVESEPFAQELGS
ncbi:hypothetical protein I545_3093 [Mycobacterium kansasii 662]|uniref:Uncharacterized protein n=1 Tax=Mycobacterium kansasii 662 TaxID=1299326 RepID=X7ZE60_MYCKA|nr:hypothetical protein I547_3363 [Mycobacterium kansasii 824]EUA17832.1 hypothetical protein I545_3093 [Mycobacterium kansasii 662]KEP39650.1 hypothetical protein MKSMC1_52020 [Mycobacterium kansasii]